MLSMRQLQQQMNIDIISRKNAVEEKLNVRTIRTAINRNEKADIIL